MPAFFVLCESSRSSARFSYIMHEAGKVSISKNAERDDNVLHSIACSTRGTTSKWRKTGSQSYPSEALLNVRLRLIAAGIRGKNAQGQAKHDPTLQVDGARASGWDRHVTDLR